MKFCKRCGHEKDRHFDTYDEDAGGHLRADWGCWECDDEHRFEEDNQK